jgi:hypothetical protein
LSAGICAFTLCLLIVKPVAADTGTYEIKDYYVILDPQSDGNVKITITQTWVVESGNIPWVTVGLPNSHFTVDSMGENAAKVTADNSGGFTGVRVDLDKTYLIGEEFKIQFTVLQSNLLERLVSQNRWQIVYTPGWYDHSFVDHMEIDVNLPVSTESLTSVEPTPEVVNSNQIVWERYTLVPGQHFTITAQSSDGSFLTNVDTNSNGGSYDTFGSSGFPVGIIIFVVVLGAFVMLLIWAAVKAHQHKQALITKTEAEMENDPEKKKTIESGFEKYVDDKGIIPDNQGRYYDRSYGNYITPAIWAVVLNNNNRRPPTSGFTGGHSSCACACVSCACACACACAGGGAAGCTKKGFHQCENCDVPARPPVGKV